MAAISGRSSGKHINNRHALSIRISMEAWQNLKDLGAIQKKSYSQLIEEALNEKWDREV